MIKLNVFEWMQFTICELNLNAAVFKEAYGRIKLFIILMKNQRYKDAQALA